MIENTMLEQFISSEVLNGVFQKVVNALEGFDSSLIANQAMKNIPILLMLIALFLLLLMVIVVFFRTVFYLFKSNNQIKKGKNEADFGMGVFEEDEAESDEERQELERELQKELELAINERILEEEKVKEEKVKEKSVKAKEAEKNKTEEKQEKIEYKNNQIELDWQKGQKHTAEEKVVDEKILSYKQNKVQLQHLMGLIIDMLGRDVDDLKIAQTINYKNQGMNEENEILKAIDALKMFIDLCVSGKFVGLKNYQDLPKEEEALYHIANGDPSLALALLESLMDKNIDKANGYASEEKRQKLYNEVSSYACCFGALAEQSDIMLATSSYELALELQSTNVVAWSYLGDVYKKANSQAKAVWAFENVLNYADEEIDIAQIANANKNLSEYLYAEGNSLQAAKLYNNSKQYYDSLGINRRLDKQELDVISIIEENRENNLSATIQKLLGREMSA